MVGAQLCDVVLQAERRAHTALSEVTEVTNYTMGLTHRAVRRDRSVRSDQLCNVCRVPCSGTYTLSVDVRVQPLKGLGSTVLRAYNQHALHQQALLCCMCQDCACVS